MNWVKNHIDPEKLWIQYTLALCVVIAFLASIHIVNTILVEHKVQVMDTVNTSDGLTMQGQQILLIALQDDLTELEQLPVFVQQFEAKHHALLQSRFWSPALQEHYFSGQFPLDSQIRQFADLAAELTMAPVEERAAIVIQIQELHNEMGLADALKKTIVLFETEAAVISEKLQVLLQKILGFSVVVLIAEALLIFFPAQIKVKSVFRELRTKTEVLSNSQDQLRRMNEKLSHLVNHDPLTGLPNRSQMVSYFQSTMNEDVPKDLGILFVGLDGFKAINDSIGHENADTLLISVAGRLRHCVDEDDLVARIGGDEFVLTTIEPPSDLVRRVMASLVDPFAIDGRSINVRASVGHLSAHDSNFIPDQILANAGLALQAAKVGGGGQAINFTQQLRDDYTSMQQLQTELREAIELGQIEPWFQPQVNLADGTLRGSEVLARWRHPSRGLLTPDKFLPAAERAGLIVELDHSVWNAAINYADQWQREGVWRPTISLNAAPDTISDPFLIERLLKQMHSNKLNLDQIIIEILETTVIESSDDMAAINIDGLAECGITLELDDFGTGYASLSRLTQLPLSGIKLDRSLITPLPDPAADSVVRAILALAAELGLEVVAEGIEEDTQFEHLNAQGCAIGQGYGFARPMAPDDFDKWLRTKAIGPACNSVTAPALPMRA